MLIAQINQILYMTEEGFELPFAQANSYPVMTGDQHHSATVSQPHSNNSRVSSTSSRKPSMAQVPEAVAQMHLMQMADIISTES